MGESIPSVKWPASPAFSPPRRRQKFIQARKKKKSKTPERVAVVRFTCPKCGKATVTTVDKKTVKKMLKDIKKGGNPVPPTAYRGQIVERTKK